MKPYKTFLQYVVPSMLAFALSGVYAIADGFFVGNELGDNALAAINIAYPLTALLQAAGTGIGMGGAIRYTITMASEKGNRKDKYFGTACWMMILASLFLMALFFLCAKPILQLFGASGEILLLCQEYIRFITYGAVFQILATGMLPLIRNMGGVITGMSAMIAGFVTNIIFDYLFVWVMPYGMAGAAIATVMGQAVTLVVCLGFLVIKKQKPILSLGKDTLGMAKEILQVGLSPFGLAFSPNITLILVNKWAVIYGGDFAVTCYSPVSYICTVVLLLLQGVSDGVQPLISQSYGKGQTATTKQYRKYAYGFSFMVAAICFSLLFFYRKPAAALFGSSAEVTDYVAEILPYFIGGTLFVSISRITTAYFYATEKNKLAYILIYGESVFLLGLLVLLAKVWSLWGVWLAVPGAQCCVFIISLVLVWKEKRKAGEQNTSRLREG